MQGIFIYLLILFYLYLGGIGDGLSHLFAS